jgi:hypothetical protein
MSIIEDHVYMRNFINVMIQDDTLFGTGLESLYHHQWTQLKRNVDQVIKNLVKSIYHKDRSLFIETTHLAAINVCYFEQYTGNHLSRKSS